MKKIPLAFRALWCLARLSLLVLAGATVVGACANRGMKDAPLDSDSGSGGAVTDMGGAGTGGAGGSGTGGAGTGGAGTGGASPAGSGGAVADVAPDQAPPITDARDSEAGRDTNTDRPCPPTTIPFESATTTARLGTAQAAATSITNSTSHPYCGQRSLEITTAFSGTSGNTTKAEVLIDLAAAQQNLAGKSITIHLSAIPDPPATLYVALTLITGTGNVDLTPVIKPLTRDWTTQSYRLPAGADGGVMMVRSISIQIFDFASHSGKIYVDGIDIR